MTRYIVGNCKSHIWGIFFTLIFSYVGGYCISHPSNVNLWTYYTVFIDFKSLFLGIGGYIFLFSCTVIYNSLINLRLKLKFYEKLYQSMGSLITTAIEKYCSREIAKGNPKKGTPLEIQKLRIKGGNGVGLVNLAEVILKKGDKMLTEDDRCHLNDLDNSMRTVAFSSIQPAFWVHPALFTYLISNGVKCVAMYGEQQFNKTFYHDLLESSVDNFEDNSCSFIRFFIYNNDIYRYDPYFKVILDFHNRFKIPYLMLKKDSLITSVLDSYTQHDYIKTVLDWQRKVYNNIHQEKIPEQWLDPKHWSKLPFFLDFVKFDILEKGSLAWYQNDRVEVDNKSCQAVCIKEIVNLTIISWDEIVESHESKL